jgi:predicted phage terminase large subunit-like protein
VEQAWPVVEPGATYVPNWHIAEICRHLEAVRDGTMKQLLITIPPGHMKSRLVSVFWPAWMWLHRPDWRVIFASYSHDLALRDSVHCRMVVTSEWYQQAFHPTWTLAGDQNVKSYFSNTATGSRMALGVGGGATGFRGDCIVVDDPLNAKDQLSEAARKTALFWWDHAFANRLNDLRTGARVVIMQRLHEEDLAGHLLEQGGWDHLCFPSRFVPERRSVTSLGIADPRTERGELLFPARFPEDVLQQEEARLLETGFASQHQQQPAPETGAMFKVDRLEIIDALPTNIVARCRFWDAAGTPDGGDWTVGLLMAKTADGKYIVEDIVRGQWGSEDVDRQMLNTARTDGKAVEIGEEEEPGSSGKAVIKTHANLLAGFTYRGAKATGDKQTRAKPFAAQVNVGNVQVFRHPQTGSPWIKAYLNEMKLFPFGKHDDQVDGSSGAFHRLTLVNTDVVAAILPRDTSWQRKFYQ